MAWRSSGNSNDDMVDNLKRFGVISSDTIENGFRNVDRKYFVPKGHDDVAHSDQPLKEGNVHISAPHIYGSALESLELVPNSSLSFLNIGSGTGYLSCIVADILGHRSLNYGVEIHADVVEHSKVAISKWKQARTSGGDPKMDSNGRNIPLEKAKTAHIEIIHGNGLKISNSVGECKVGFDRIYIGAAVEKANLYKITKLLRPGGILVGPVEDELVKVVRIGSSEDDNENRPAADDGMEVERNSISQNTDNDVSSNTHSDNDFTQQVLSGVRFAPLTSYPSIETIIPSKVWQPSAHQTYPDSFRIATKQLMLCSYSEYNQPPPKPQKPKSGTNFAALLPPALWIEILSFTHRNWFEPPRSEAAFLRKRLLEEQANSKKAHQARIEAEGRCHIAERERDVYRLLARRWQARVEALLEQRSQPQSSSTTRNNVDGADEEIDDVGASLALALSGHEQAAIFGLGAMLRHLNRNNDEDVEDATTNQNQGTDRHMDGANDNNREEEDDNAMGDNDDYDFDSDGEDGMDDAMDDSDDLPAPSKALIVRAVNGIRTA